MPWWAWVLVAWVVVVGLGILLGVVIRVADRRDVPDDERGAESEADGDGHR
ncbi:hypothetical protein ACI78R_18250 [Geodermatophilus sp. SYSU D01106]